ncbi:MAG: hypothetical protein MRY83_12505, partial [Flavobacteriales bacterium]|nr:hypothetical protein [Flavobacteriales bacterium]
SASDYYHKFLEFSKNLGFFDYLDGGLIAKLNQNSGDSQALSKIIRDEFGSLHKKLDSEGKGEISTLILIGSWIESTHVYLETYEQNHNTKIHDIIGAQKIVLNKLIILLSNYSSNNGYLFEFKEKLNILLDKFSGVKIAYTHDTLLEANSKEEFLNIEDKTRTVTVSDEELQEIRISLEELRNNLIKN